MNFKTLLVTTLALALPMVIAVPTIQAQAPENTIIQEQKSGGFFRNFFGFKGGENNQRPRFQRRNFDHQDSENTRQNWREKIREKRTGRREKLSPEMQTLMQELRNAYQSGDEEKVSELREKLKIVRESEREKSETERDNALAGGYVTWKNYILEKEDPRSQDLAEKITAKNFDKFVQLQNLMKQVRELSEELDLGKPRKR